jgi:signal transduction histidine kinase
VDARPASAALLVVEEGALRELGFAILGARVERVIACGDAVSFAEAYAAGGFDVAVVSAELAWAQAFSLVAALRRRHPALTVLLVGRPDAPGAVAQAMAAGVAAFVPATVAGLAELASHLPPPIDLRGELEALRRQRAEAEAEGAAPAREVALGAAELAHDLREPLRTIRLHLERAEQRLATTDLAAARTLLARAYDASGRMDELVDAALGALDAGAGGSSFADRVLDEVLEQLAATVESAGASVSRTPLPELPVAPHLLRQILQNLIANAVHHGGDPPVVHVAAAREAGTWVLSVRDNGPGVPPEQRDVIFRPLSRLVEGRGGHGLGLAISRKLATRAGARLWVEDAPGGGACFRLGLPEPPGLGEAERPTVLESAPRRRDV